MRIFDKAKEISGKVISKTLEFSSDGLIADAIELSVSKQEKVNAVLKERDSKYRIRTIDLEMGIPPKVIFNICKVSGELDSNKTNATGISHKSKN